MTSLTQLCYKTLAQTIEGAPPMIQEMIVKDTSKYMEFMESTLDQLTSSMDLDFDTILGKPKQTGLEQFFWN